MKLKKLAILLFLSACASSAAWIEQAPPLADRTWRVPCDKEHDGEQYANKGMCYISKQCVKKLWWLECKPKQYFCAWGDMQCMIDNDLNGRKLVK